MQIGEAEGLTCVYTLVSDCNDWDHYASLKWTNIDDFVRANPNDPDVLELIERITKEKDIYLRWERDTLGWAIDVFRKGYQVGWMSS